MAPVASIPSVTILIIMSFNFLVKSANEIRNSAAKFTCNALAMAWLINGVCFYKCAKSIFKIK